MVINAISLQCEESMKLENNRQLLVNSFVRFKFKKIGL